MMRRLVTLILIAGLSAPALAAPPVKAKTGGADQMLPEGAMYRYTDEENRLVITHTLPQEAIYLGYEIIDAQGRVLDRVAKALPEEERLRQREELSQRRRDEDLRKLYPTAGDAERARDRKVGAIKLNIDYAQNTIGQLNTKLAAEVSAAAKLEKAGREIPKNMQATIDQFNRQIREQNVVVDQLNKDIEAVNQEFDGIIKRLRQLGYE